jgi:hypothetical protein
MERSQLFRLIQEKIDAEIGNKLNGRVVFTVSLGDGGIRLCECQTTEILQIQKKPELKVIAK